MSKLIDARHRFRKRKPPLRVEDGVVRAPLFPHPEMVDGKNSARTAKGFDPETEEYRKRWEEARRSHTWSPEDRERIENAKFKSNLGWNARGRLSFLNGGKADSPKRGGDGSDDRGN